MAALSLPVGIHTYLMMRALCALNRVHGRLATGVCRVVDCGTMTGMVIMHRTLSLTFLATNTMAFQAAVSTFCTNSSS